MRGFLIDVKKKKRKGNKIREKEKGGRKEGRKGGGKCCA